MTDLFCFASFLPFPPQVLREETLELSLDIFCLLVDFAHVRLDMKLAMVYHLYLGIALMYFSLSDVVFI